MGGSTVKTALILGVVAGAILLSAAAQAKDVSQQAILVTMDSVAYNHTAFAKVRPWAIRRQQ